MIVIISGTNRPGSCTLKVATTLKSIYAGLGVPVQLLDLTTLPPEIILPSAYAQKPAGFQPFADTVLAANGLVVVTPEYNGSFPGVLKYFIDHLPFPESFERRPVCFVGLAAGIWGALRAVEQLQGIFGYRNAHIYPERVFIPGITKLIDPAGTFANAEMEARLAKQAAGFVEFVANLRNPRLKP